jgi:hypothetical protein
MASLFPKIRIFILFSLLAALLVSCGDIEDGVVTITISPTNATVGVNHTQLFTATVKNSVGQIISADPTWTSSGNIGNISSAGFFTAGSSTGEGTVAASYESDSASTAVTVTDNGWLTGRIEGILTSNFVPGIRVYLDGTSFSDFSDAEGRYVISDIPAGTYEALTQATTTYKASSTEVTIGSGETVTWDIILETQPGVDPVPTTTLPTF